MEMMQAQVLAQMSSSLVDLVVKGTASVVETKIKASKEIKDIEKLRATYDALINEVLVEREEAIRIAQAYKSELDRIVISDEDIAHLHNTVAQILEILKDLQLKSACAKGKRDVEKVESQSAIYEQIKKLISVDTLKTMQLLGFNYKEAIGEPLTQICANTITSWGNRTKTPPVSEKLKSQPNRR